MISSRANVSLAWVNASTIWSPTIPSGSIDMTSAENWLIRPYEIDAMKMEINTSFTNSSLSYNGNTNAGTSPLLNKTADYVNKFFEPKVEIEGKNVALQSGAMKILDSLFYSICDENESLLIDAPFWSGFGNAAHLRNNDKLIEVPRATNFSDPDAIIAQYEAAMQNSSTNVCGIIVCNPHNPTGHIYPDSYLKKVLQFAEKYDIHYISDEVYALSTWESLPTVSLNSDIIYESPETKFKSIVSFNYTELGVNSSRVHLVYSISKDLGSSGLRLGVLVTTNEDVRKAVVTVERHTVSTATGVMADALFSNLTRTKEWLDLSRHRLTESAGIIGEFMTCHSIPFYRPVGGLVLWARLGGTAATYQTDMDLWTRISTAGAAIEYGAEFHESEFGWFRILFALPQKQLITGLRHIQEGLGTNKTCIPADDTLTSESIVEVPAKEVDVNAGVRRLRRSAVKAI